MNKYLIIILLSIGFAACSKESNKKAQKPQIDGLNLSDTLVRAGNRADRVVLQFGFRDGDGDIGAGLNDIFLIDSRDSSELGFMLPIIQNEYKNPETGETSGVAQLTLPANQFFLPRTDSIHTNFGDTLFFHVYMKDKAMQVSNILQTDTIYIKTK